MGAFLSMFGLAADSSRKTGILMVGLDNAGKTTILYKLKLDQDKEVTTTPTIGFNLETIKYRNLTLLIRDVGGQDKLRRLWRNYYEGTDAVIFVVDSNDRDRMPLAKDELHKLMDEDVLSDAVVLVYGNKQDQPHALAAADLSAALDVPAIQAKGFNIFVQPSAAVTCEGIFEGLDWLSNTLKKRRA
ncbi:ADP-ribosylation factor [Diplonema papillatum]|nr:ADP-ribosylation factor [Diplonema papillatum]|eukprot:gene16010-24514_t